MRLIVLGLMVVSMSAFAADQTATLDVGNRKVVLHDNGTWEWLPDSETKLIETPKDIESSISLVEKTLSVASENGKDSIVLAVNFENHTMLEVKSLELYMAVKNSAGQVLYTQTLKDKASIAPGKRHAVSTKWSWMDLKSVKDDPYSKMLPSVSDGSAVVELKVIRLLFENGTILMPSAKN